MDSTLVPIKKKQVEDYLAEVDYSWDNFKPTIESLEFITFMQELNNGQDENKSSVMHTAMMEKVFNSNPLSLILVHRGSGKLESPDTPILTPNGWTTMEDIKEGDKVVNRFGKATEVIYKTEKQYPKMYKMTLTDGTILEVGDEHRHIVWKDRRTPKKGRNTEFVLTTDELIASGLTCNKNRKSNRYPKIAYKFGIPLSDPIEFSYKNLPEDPYVFGIFLANGYFKGGQLSCHLDDMIEISKEINDRGYPVSKMEKTSESGDKILISDKFFKNYRHMVSQEKMIPDLFMYSSISQRLDLLRGLMDGDGSISSNGSSRYHSTNKSLALGVRDLVRSLGGISYIREDDRPDKPTYDMEYTTIVNMKLNPFKLSRKASKWKPTKKMTKGIVSIEPIDNSNGGYCIAVKSEDHSYITNGYTVTHNTTIFAESLFLYIAAFNVLPGFGNVSLILYVTDSIENGVKNLRRNIEHRYQESEMMQKLIPNRRISVIDENDIEVDVTNSLDEYKKSKSAGVKFTDIRLEFQNWAGKKTVIKGYGASVGVRGAKEMGQRPNLVVMDDVLSDSDAKSPTIIDTIKDTIYKAVGHAIHPTKSKQIWLGTPFNQNDPIYEAAGSGQWDVACFPVAENFDSTTTKETFKGSWEERFPFEMVKKKFDLAIAVGRPDDFYQELMLQISNADDRLIPERDITYFNRHIVLENQGMYNFYVTTDAATTDHASADFSVIMVWAINKDKDILLVDFWFGKVLLNEFINNLFRITKMYRTNMLGVGIEVSGQQGGTISTIKDKMIAEDNYFRLLSYGNGNKEGIRPATGMRKYERFQVMQPRFSTHKIKFPDDCIEDPFMIELFNELRFVSKTNTGRKIGRARNDDILDCLAMLSMFDLYSPVEEDEVKKIEYNEHEFNPYDDFIEAELYDSDYDSYV